jgi:hypothetical protein
MFRPFYITLALLLLPAALRADEPLRLQEDLRPGQQFQMSIRTELTGKMTLPAELTKDKKPADLALTGNSTIDYVERILAWEPKSALGRVLRLYRTMEFKRQVNGEALENALRPPVRRVVVARSDRIKTGFSPDGPLTFAEIDMLRGDMFTPVLLGLLPTKPVQVGETWKATTAAVRELTDLEQITGGELECSLGEIVHRQGQQYALVRFKGVVQGTGTEGTNRQKLDGFLHFDLTTSHLSHLFFNGTSWLLNAEGKPRGRIEGRYILHRKPTNAWELAEAALTGVALEPTMDNTRMLFSDPTIGVELTYPRHWTMRQADAKQVILDEPNGNGLLITLEPPDRTPTAEQYRNEVELWLRKENIKVLRSEPPQRLQTGVDTVDRFAWEAEIKEQSCLLDYYVVRQAAAGATCAGRWNLANAAVLRPEAERIVKSLRLTKARK